MPTWHELTYFNSISYGRAVRVSRRTIISLMALFCLLTFGTNWMIPLLPRLVKKGMVVRY
jgi:hypothetical protein